MTSFKFLSDKSTHTYYLYVCLYMGYKHKFYESMSIDEINDKIIKGGLSINNDVFILKDDNTIIKVTRLVDDKLCLEVSISTPDIVIKYNFTYICNIDETTVDFLNQL